MESIEKLEKIMEYPEKQYRSAPFWGWNDRIMKENINFQVGEMKKQGMGGFFIHSREGLETPYLSEEWMDAVEQAVDTAKVHDMEVWLYDEDKWPSGSAGGMVSAKNPKAYTAKALTFELCHKNKRKGSDSHEAEGEIIGIYPYGEKGEIVLRMEASKNSEWYNLLAPSDNLNPKAVQEFLQLTHEQYKKKIGNEFGKTIKGFFTDEPNCFDFFSQFTEGRPWVQWTQGFEEYFEKKRGYNPVPYLPWLFVEDFRPQEGGDISKEMLRHDFWRCVSERFSESYMKQVYDWCEKNALSSTGHMLYENDLGYQIRVCGSAMPQYRYLHAPGIDILGEQTKEYLTVKQCTSVANQYGREMVISETYGCTGWDFTMEGQKWLADWQFVMGVTRRCQHLAQYSITGCRKRDYPPVFNYQTTWWENNHYIEDYYARLTCALTTGKVVREVLLLHPMSSVWVNCSSAVNENLENMEMNMGWKDEQFVSLNRMGETYNRVARMLLANHIDFDFGDEIILEEAGQVTGNRLEVLKASYSVVVIPRVYSLFQHTYKLLAAFAEAGGSIIWVSPYPDMVEGKRNADKLLKPIMEGIHFQEIASYESLSDAVIKALGRKHLLTVKNSSFLEDEDILSMVRKTEDGYILFLVNNDREKNHEVVISLSVSGTVTEVGLMTGDKIDIPVERTYGEDKKEENRCGRIRFNTGIPAAGSRLFLIKNAGMNAEYCERNIADNIFFEKEKEDTHMIKKVVQMNHSGLSAQVPYRHPHAADEVFAVIGPVTDARRTMENVLTLDKCSYSLDGGPYSAEMNVWEAQRNMRLKLGMQQVYYNGAPQRYTWIYENPEEGQAPFSLKFVFSILELPKTDVYLVIEKPEGLTVSCNGTVCPCTQEWFMDRDMKKYKLCGLKNGLQEIKISGVYKKSMELEDIYVVGNFAVSRDREIIQEPAQLHFGDWCYQGYYHYPGNMICSFYIPSLPRDRGHKRILLKPGEFKAVLLKIRINGRDAGILLNSKETLDVTEYLEENHNFLEIEVVGSPRNMFGPFHQKYTECSRISWEDFRTEGEYYTPDYIVKPFGLMGQIILCKVEAENDCR